MIDRPMLAAAVVDAREVKFPVIASPKLDGIRCLIHADSGPVTRAFKLIPNDYIRSQLDDLPDWLDGELMLADQDAPFQAVTSAVMSGTGEPDFVYWVFDYAPDAALGYSRRLEALQLLVKRLMIKFPWLRRVPTTMCADLEALQRFEEKCLAQGFEGVCLRSPDGPYKFGRSTLKEGYLLKLKRFEHGEAVIVGFEEQQANENKATTDELGRAKRSTHKTGKRGKGTLGAFIVVPVEKIGLTEPGMVAESEHAFRIGGGDGLTASLRQEIWDKQDSYLGQLIRYRWQAHGTKNAPRIPQFEGFRDWRDL